ncbi:MAG: HNH endonuclease, partial [Clostridiaceae bacterium]
LENDISTFERKLFVSVFNKIKEEDDELTSVVIEKGDVEGAKITYFTTKYERSVKNRLEAINIHGTKCRVCGFNFESVYGELGKGFIEVHHIKPLYDLEEEVYINPLTDLVCLCSNCHRMIHRKKDGIFSVKELRELIQSNKGRK